MLTKNEIINSIELKEICQKENITYLALFGSYKTEEADENSDIDFIVKIKGNQSLFKLIKISQEISQIFGKKVDLLTENSISPYILENIKNGMEVVYYNE